MEPVTIFITISTSNKRRNILSSGYSHGKASHWLTDLGTVRAPMYHTYPFVEYSTLSRVKWTINSTEQSYFLDIKSSIITHLQIVMNIHSMTIKDRSQDIFSLRKRGIQNQKRIIGTICWQNPPQERKTK